jgi:2-methylcitrate dehydratase PrpD
VEADEAISQAFPEIQAAVVTIRATDGRTWSERVDYPKGEPENPLTEAEFHSRYNGLMAYAGVMPEISEQIYITALSGNGRAKELLEQL